jgi:hypothetical protein
MTPAPGLGFGEKGDGKLAGIGGGCGRPGALLGRGSELGMYGLLLLMGMLLRVVVGRAVAAATAGRMGPMDGVVPRG